MTQFEFVVSGGKPERVTAAVRSHAVKSGLQRRTTKDKPAGSQHSEDTISQKLSLKGRFRISEGPKKSASRKKASATKRSRSDDSESSSQCSSTSGSPPTHYVEEAQAVMVSPRRRSSSQESLRSYGSSFTFDPFEPQIQRPLIREADFFLKFNSLNTPPKEDLETMMLSCKAFLPLHLFYFFPCLFHGGTTVNYLHFSSLTFSQLFRPSPRMPL